MNAKNPRGWKGYTSPKARRVVYHIPPVLQEQARRKRANKRRHCTELTTVVVDVDHRGRRLRVRSRRPGLSGRQWKKLYKGVGRELAKRDRAAAAIGLTSRPIPPHTPGAPSAGRLEVA